MSSQKTPAPKTDFSKSSIQEMSKFLKRNLRYEKDVLQPAQQVDICNALAEADAALRLNQKEKIQEAGGSLSVTIEKNFPRPKDASWRENVEVLLVAFVLAFAIRTYFLQPFQIPTASMQPTLFGIEVQASHIPAAEYPGAFRKIWEKIAFGKSYVRLIAPSTGSLTTMPVQIKETNLFLYWLTFSTVVIDGQKQYVWMPRDYIVKALEKRGTRPFAKGDVIISSCVQTGDFVFVDKVTYNFRKPARGDVFVFLTDNIYEITRDQRARGVMGAEYYIKRLTAIGGDKVQIIPPHLFVNGGIAEFNDMFQKIYSLENGYKGYVHLPGNLILPDDDAIYTLPEKSYFALGDNSPNSWDSRGWGTVPDENVVGKAFIVFYPFGSRWGLIR